MATNGYTVLGRGADGRVRTSALVAALARARIALEERDDLVSVQAAELIGAAEGRLTTLQYEVETVRCELLEERRQSAVLELALSRSEQVCDAIAVEAGIPLVMGDA